MPPFFTFLNIPSTSIDTSRQPPNESFSFSWQLIGTEPVSEIGSDTVSRHRSSASDAYEFDFGLPRPDPPILAHADQIFSNGFLLPLHVVDRSKGESTSESWDATLSRSLSLGSSESYFSLSNRYRARYSCNAMSRLDSLEDSPRKFKLPNSLRNCASKYLCFRLPWSKKARSRIGRSRLKERDESSSVEWHRSNKIFDNSYESAAIDEAILHCKRSIVSPARHA